MSLCGTRSDEVLRQGGLDAATLVLENLKPLRHACFSATRIHEAVIPLRDGRRRPFSVGGARALAASPSILRRHRLVVSGDNSTGATDVIVERTGALTERRLTTRPPSFTRRLAGSCKNLRPNRYESRPETGAVRSRHTERDERGCAAASSTAAA